MMVVYGPVAQWMEHLGRRTSVGVSIARVNLATIFAFPSGVPWEDHSS
jgi:hypothetical protein